MTDFGAPEYRRGNEKKRLVFTDKAVSDMRLLLERRFGKLPAAEARAFLQDLYEEGYMLVTVTEVG